MNRSLQPWETVEIDVIMYGQPPELTTSDVLIRELAAEHVPIGRALELLRGMLWFLGLAAP